MSKILGIQIIDKILEYKSKPCIICGKKTCTDSTVCAKCASKCNDDIEVCVCAFCEYSEIEMPEYIDGRQISAGICWCNKLNKSVDGTRCEVNDD